MERLSTLLVVSCAVLVAGLTAYTGARAVRSLPVDVPTVSPAAPAPTPAAQPVVNTTPVPGPRPVESTETAAQSAGDVKTGEVDLSLVTDYPTPEERRFWTKAIKKIWLRPPCCGACSVISQDDFRVLARVMATDSKETPETRKAWNRYSAPLLVATRNQDPELYGEFLRLKGKGVAGDD